MNAFFGILVSLTFAANSVCLYYFYMAGRAIVKREEREAKSSET